jgi:hypothetical protein
MRILATIVYLAVTALLFACDQQHSASDVDPKLGLECFENHRASLLPGTQYEGIEKLAGNRLAIRIMNGVDVVTLECVLTPDGTLESTGK